MRIEEYKMFNEGTGGWDFQNIKFGRINLLVGESGSGKSRILNTIFNLSMQTVTDKLLFPGGWEIVFKVGINLYRWNLLITQTKNLQEFEIQRELLTKINNGIEEKIIERNADMFFYRGNPLPKLSKSVSSIKLMKEENEISEMYDGFSLIMARRFFRNELTANFNPNPVPKEVMVELLQKKDLKLIFKSNPGFHNRLFLLKELFSAKYDEVIDYYKEVFPFITEFKFEDIKSIEPNKELPFISKVLFFKEKNISDWISSVDISSGMQKVFLIALDIFMNPDDSILIIDEFENSLGMNSLNSLSSLLLSARSKLQIIISSHHPYLINQIPISNWLICHRKGMNISIRSGKEIKDKYSNSLQQQYIQLINDPFYTDGIE